VAMVAALNTNTRVKIHLSIMFCIISQCSNDSRAVQIEIFYCLNTLSNIWSPCDSTRLILEALLNDEVQYKHASL